ncbi:hypothetical protein [Tenacibaculum sp. UWU-22]|uniref:hypothetical protein n=1 Tax=Tenacibaculum sp. UWU-22 TaxID=3234187 RepID=UPI0034DB408B
MNKTKIIGWIIITISFFECKSLLFEKKPPFTINQATYSNYVGGIPGTSGTWIRLAYQSNQKIKFDSIYFRDKQTKVELQTIKGTNYVSGHFNTNSFKNNLILHNNGKKEYGNKLPEIKKKPRFKLAKNEAVISYTENGKTKYIKIKNVQETDTKLYK